MRNSRTRHATVLLAIWMAAALAVRAEAASLFKCSDREGRVSYQSAPCGPGEQQVWERELVIDGKPSPVPAPAGSTAAAPKVPIAARGPARQAGNAPRAGPPRKSASRACRSARAADAAYRAQPLSRVTHDGLRRHGDRIRLACGPG